MDFKELAVARYSVRKFADTPVEPEKLAAILEAGRNTPTAHNNQPQRIFVCQSPEAVAKVESTHRFHWGAPVTLIVACDPSVAWVRPLDGKNYGEVDASLAIAQMMLQATDLGLGTTFIGMFDAQALAEAFPEQLKGLVPVGLLPVGYPAPGAAPSPLHTIRMPLTDMVKFL